MISQQVKVINKLGLHARAATKLVNCASRFESNISVARGAREVNAKSIMGVLTLAAAAGTELTVEADGPDEAEAMQAVTRLFLDYFGEGE
jgi:phosphocarrier protein